MDIVGLARRVFKDSRCFFKVVAVIVLCVPTLGFSHEKVAKVQRFMSTRSGEVNLRRGPGQHFPVDWKIVRSDYPLEVVAEYGTWRKVRDFEGSEGWIHQGMLGHKRTGITLSATTLYKKPDSESHAIAVLEPKVFLTVQRIEPFWCRVKVDGKTGWVQRSHIWGLLSHE